jgi:cytidyltransferase-like protein
MRVLITDSFDNFRSHHARLLHEAHRLGSVHVALWSDRAMAVKTGKPPSFPEAERLYLVSTNRYVTAVSVAGAIDAAGKTGCIPSEALIAAVQPDLWLDAEENRARADFCSRRGFGYRVLTADDLAGFPEHDPGPEQGPMGGAVSIPNRKVVVTGCFDWFHSGHVRFFEEASAYGKLYVVVGSDENVRLLKGEGHPQFPQDERRYLVGSVRYVSEVLVSTGSGWLDAEPEIRALKPDLYIVNEDGDRPEKREFCRQHDMAYLVLKRIPREGLAPRSSTVLRRF